MGKRNLCTGLLIGAVVGGLVSLLNKDTRNYTKNKWDSTKTTASYYFSNPTEAVRNVKQSVDQLNSAVSQEAQNAINALEQVENTLAKVWKK
ncbi:YtxH domain-containing protein [Virgibacillus sp. W0181]|uniref:YtxH domain-containing protein n=1 Tax=Virgibacillus sp. W0181 TaxID=3391581 RepID=UPI003F45C157